MSFIGGPSSKIIAFSGAVEIAQAAPLHKAPATAPSPRWTAGRAEGQSSGKRASRAAMFGGVAAIARVVKSFFDSAANSRSRGMEVTQRMDGKTQTLRASLRYG